MAKNKLIIAAAGSGKTTQLVKEALSVSEGNVLITTFTEANEQEILKKIRKSKRFIPKNVTVQTWFSFLLKHGVRPYQGIMNDILFAKRIGFYLSEGKSGFRYMDRQNKPVYWGETDFEKYYFTKEYKIYSDKISKFVCECNAKCKNEVINRMSRIYSHIFVDEIQDIAGWDLEFLKLLLLSPIKILIVGDPRQATYSTNDSSKYDKYRNGKIAEFIVNECTRDICEIDTNTLKASHRNNQAICDFSSKLYSEYTKCEPCACKGCRENIVDHQGIFIIKEEYVKDYCSKYKTVTKLHYSKAEYPDINYGASKGLSFDRVLIYPTEKIKQYIKQGNVTAIESVKAKFYVAVTRARYSVGIVCNYDDGDYIEHVEKYIYNK